MPIYFFLWWQILFALSSLFFIPTNDCTSHTLANRSHLCKSATNRRREAMLRWDSWLRLNVCDHEFINIEALRLHRIALISSSSITLNHHNNLWMNAAPCRMFWLTSCYFHTLFSAESTTLSSKCLAIWYWSVSLDKRHLKIINGFAVAIELWMLGYFDTAMRLIRLLSLHSITLERWILV